MPFEKGHKKVEGSGMKKGQKTEKAQRWEEFSEFMLNEGLMQVEARMQNLSDKDYIQTINSFMEYFKPKQARIEESVKMDAKIDFDWKK